MNLGLSISRRIMPNARPFLGLLYDPGAGAVETLTSPPYDLISPLDQDRLYRASPYNVVRLILGKEEPGDDASSNKYTRAASSLRSWREEGTLRLVPEPAVYPYEMSFHLGGSRRRVRGLIVEVELEPWGGSILPHERTMPGPIEDRLSLLRAAQANLSPVYAVHAERSDTVARFLDAATSPPPTVDLVDESGTQHRMWVSTEGSEAVVAALRPHTFMIADGHHRYTVALACREEMRAKAGPGPWDSIMMFVVDAATEDPPVLPIHRLLVHGGSHWMGTGSDWMGTEPDRMGTEPDRMGTEPDGIKTGAGRIQTGPKGQQGGSDAIEGERVRDMAEVLASMTDDELTFGFVRIESGDLAHRIARLEGNPPTVCALHEQVLDRFSGDQIRFIPDAFAVERAVLSGEASIGYLLPPTRVERVFGVLESGATLPQKSTYFWPKPRAGMVIRPFHP
jgi:uncharacterized protein (DUF1015 family)